MFVSNDCLSVVRWLFTGATGFTGFTGDTGATGQTGFTGNTGFTGTYVTFSYLTYLTYRRVTSPHVQQHLTKRYLKTSSHVTSRFGSSRLVTSENETFS